MLAIFPHKKDPKNEIFKIKVINIFTGVFISHNTQITKNISLQISAHDGDKKEASSVHPLLGMCGQISVLFLNSTIHTVYKHMGKK